MTIGVLASASFLSMLLAGSSPAREIRQTDLLAGLSNDSRWIMHSGDYSSRRHSPLKQITPSNVGKLRALWTFQTGVVAGGNAITKFEATPIVVDSVIYVTGINNTSWAIDGRTGKQIWRYQRELPQGLKICCGPVNRGFAVHGGRLYMATLDAHVIALEANTGKPVWDVALADYKMGYASTAAPVIGELLQSRGKRSLI